LTSKNKRDKREQAHKERVRQLRTGEISAPPPPVPPSPVSTRKVAQASKSDLKAFALDEAEVASRQSVIADMMRDYSANILQIRNFLEKYEERAERLQEDRRKFIKRSQELFSQPEFSQCHLNRKVIKYISDKIGGLDYSPVRTKLQDFTKQLVRGVRAIPEGEVQWLLIGLMSAILKLIEQNRVDEAIIAIVSFLATVEAPKDLNPFTMAMLIQGLDNYNANKGQAFEALLEKLGLTREQLRAQGAPDFDSPEFVTWLVDKLRDGKIISQLEEVLAQKPELTEYARNTISLTEGNVIILLNEPGAETLLYTKEELAQTGIFDYLNEHCQKMLNEYPDGPEAFARDSKPTKNKKKKARLEQVAKTTLEGIVIELTRRLATVEYLTLLLTRLKEYQRENLAVEKSDMTFALLEINSLVEIEDDEKRRERVAETPFLFQLANLSLKAVISSDSTIFKVAEYKLIGE